MFVMISVMSAYSMPPVRYSPECGFDGEAVKSSVSGERLLIFSELAAPSKQESRDVLLRLRRQLGISRSHMACLLGVRSDHLRRWEKGIRHPSRPAQKLIWLLDSLSNKPSRVQDALSVATWGRV